MRLAARMEQRRRSFAHAGAFEGAVGGGLRPELTDRGAVRILPDDEAEYERIGAALDALEDAAQSDDGRALAIRELGVFSLSEQLPQMIERRDEVAAAFGRLGGATVDDWTRRVRALLEGELRKAIEPERPELERLLAIRRSVRRRCGCSMFSTVTSLSADWSISR